MIIVGVVVLVFVGPDRIPELMSTAGKYYGRFRRMSDDLRRAFNAEVARHEADRRRQELEARRLAAESARLAEREAARLGEAPAPDAPGGEETSSASGRSGVEAEPPSELPGERPLITTTRPLPEGVAQRTLRSQPPPTPPPPPTESTNEPEGAS